MRHQIAPHRGMLLEGVLTPQGNDLRDADESGCVDLPSVQRRADRILLMLVIP